MAKKPKPKEVSLALEWREPEALAMSPDEHRFLHDCCRVIGATRNGLIAEWIGTPTIINAAMQWDDLSEEWRLKLQRVARILGQVFLSDVRLLLSITKQDDYATTMLESHWISAAQGSPDVHAAKEKAKKNTLGPKVH